MAGFAQVAVLRQGRRRVADSDSARPGRRGGPARRRGQAVGPGALPQLAGGWAGQLASQLAGHLCTTVGMCMYVHVSVGIMSVSACICWYHVSACMYV
jgi:hypothetical protein